MSVEAISAAYAKYRAGHIHIVIGEDPLGYRTACSQRIGKSSYPGPREHPRAAVTCPKCLASANGS